MHTSQKALIVRTGPDGHEGLDELNIELERGWRVLEVEPMGGAGGGTSSTPVVAAIVILVHEDERPEPELAAQTVETIEQEADDVVDEVVDDMDEVVEGDGI